MGILHVHATTQVRNFPVALMDQVLGRLVGPFKIIYDQLWTGQVFGDFVKLDHGLAFF